MNKIIFFSTNKHEIKYIKKINKKYNFEITYTKKKLNKKNVHLAKNFNHISIFVNDNAYDKEIINNLKLFKIQTIALRCTGFNNVNLSMAKKNNIKVINVKSYSPESIAEYALSLMLNLNRKIHHAYQYTKNKNFSLKNLIGCNMYKKTIGIIGTGKIGLALIKILQGFKMNILAYDIIKSKEVENLGIKYFNLKYIFKNSDIISLHCPYNKETHHMINEKTINYFKKNVMLINTSRGELINTSSIINAIKKRKIRSLGIDVYEKEKKYFFKDYYKKIIKDNNLNILLSYNNVIITSHQAYFTKESLINIAKITLKNINKITLNKECKDCIN